MAVFAVFGAALAQAVHFHKNDSPRGFESHVQCLLCMHADRSAGPPELPRHVAPPFSLSVALTPLIVARACGPRTVCYRARGPPLI